MDSEIPRELCDFSLGAQLIEKSGYVYFGLEYQISSRLIGPLQVTLSFLLVFLSEFERSQANSCPRNLIFCAKSAKNAYFVPKLSNKTEILHFKRKI